MRQVIIDCADFAPSSLPPALRIRFFARYLPEFGWNPIIVTTEPSFYESATDPENEALVPKSLTITRTRAIPIRYARRFGFGDIGSRSLWHHWAEIKNICSTRKVDLAFISVPPYLPIVLGRMIRYRFGIPYVVDYIDPWVTEYYWHLPRKLRPPKWPLAYAMSRFLEPFALRSASALVGVSKGTTDDIVQRYRWSEDFPTAEIPYGGEPADFAYLANHPRANGIFARDDGMRHISYIGVCSPQMYPAARAVFAAIQLGLANSPQTFSRLRLHFVGSTYAANGVPTESRVMEIAREYGVQQLVDERPGRVPYLQSLQLLLDSHALLLLGSEESHYTASKVFPYILAGRPLVAVVHEASSIVTVLENLGTGRVIGFSPDRPPLTRADLICKHFEQILSSAPEPERGVSGEQFEQYTARAMTGRLAALFDQVVGSEHPQAAGAAETRISRWLIAANRR